MSIYEEAAQVAEKLSLQYSYIRSNGPAHFNTWRDCGRAIAAAIRALPEPEGWVKVSERLPEDDAVVLAWCVGWPKPQLARVKPGNTQNGDFSPGEWLGLFSEDFDGPLPENDPTHWRPLPAPPKEGSVPKS